MNMMIYVLNNIVLHSNYVVMMFIEGGQEPIYCQFIGHRLFKNVIAISGEKED